MANEKQLKFESHIRTLFEKIFMGPAGKYYIPLDPKVTYATEIHGTDAPFSDIFPDLVTENSNQNVKHPNNNMSHDQKYSLLVYMLGRVANNDNGVTEVIAHLQEAMLFLMELEDHMKEMQSKNGRE